MPEHAPRSRAAGRVSDRPTLAVFKLASCGGCQLTLLNSEDELLELAEAVEIAYFPEASRAMAEGPYDIALVEGSVTTTGDAERLGRIRRDSKLLVTLGACATAGGIQALRDLRSVEGLVGAVYPSPRFIETLATSTPVTDHVEVDYELRGCPIDRGQLLELLGALLQGRRPQLPTTSVCTECKGRGVSCLLVARGIPCLGPVTQAGCGALCPVHDRGCYGCFGPKETPNPAALAERLGDLGVTPEELVRMLSTFNTAAPAFREESLAHEHPD